MNDKLLLFCGFTIVVMFLTCCDSESTSANENFANEKSSSSISWESLSSGLHFAEQSSSSDIALESLTSSSLESSSSSEQSDAEQSSSSDFVIKSSSSVENVGEGFVRIGNQVWMEQNLYEAYLNWPEESDANPKCYGDDDESCKKYGKLFEWFHVVDLYNPEEHFDNEEYCIFISPVDSNYGICPKGTHIPSKTELEELRDYLQTHPSEQVKITNQLAGYRNEDGEYVGLGESLILWSSMHEPDDEFDVRNRSEKAWALFYNDSSGFEIIATSIYVYASVRCIVNSSD